MSLFLTPEEIKEFTGYCGLKKQTEWLRQYRIPFLLGGDGNPKVLHTAVQLMLGGISQVAPKIEPQIRPIPRRPRGKVKEVQHG
jgi:hypothetical protein